jgi:hypothetical protein
MGKLTEPSGLPKILPLNSESQEYWRDRGWPCVNWSLT